MLYSLFLFLDSLFSNLIFLLIIAIISLSLKAYILSQLITQRPSAPSNRRCWMLLIAVLISAMASDSAWIMFIIKDRWLPLMDYRPYIFWIRISWGLFALQYQALVLFLESLVSQYTKFSLRQKLFFGFSSILFLFWFGLALVNINCQHISERPAIEFIVQRQIQIIYLLLILMPLGLIFALWKLRTTQDLPQILRTQLRVLIPGLIMPVWFLDILQFFPMELSPTFTTNSYSAATLTIIFTTSALLYCTRKMANLRFLNFTNQVQSSARFNFIDGFKDVLEQLSHTTSVSELRHIAQTLFKEAFDIPLNKTRLYVRKMHDPEKDSHVIDQLQQNDQAMVTAVENFLSVQPETILQYIAATKILIHDEIAFSNFYEKSLQTQTVVRFLETIDADIFMPIYEKQQLVAYIIVERHARPGKFYGNVEHDEMLVFGSYMANIINLLQSRNLRALLQQEKELQEELYHKHQEVNQYKESIRSFLRNNQQKEIGIIFYRNRNFTFGNKTAKEMIDVNINLQEGHPLTKALRLVARHVEEYKAPFSAFANDKDGNKIVLAGVPNLEHNNVIITIYHPEMSDVIKRQLDRLHDPSDWDYLLYLETTQSGKLITQLIPGSGEKLLNFKISLLKAALSKKALLIEMPEDDLIPTVEIIHHTSLRETLHILKLQSQSRGQETAIKLFGINPIFGIQQTQKPLFEQLSTTGTLFIQNIHFLDLETQEHLAEYIKFGVYRIFKSEHTLASNVRVICSSTQNLQAMVQEGTFSKNLLAELKKTTLVMPSLLTLPEDELATLANGFIEQTIKTHDLKNLLELSEREQNKLATQRPISLQELKERIQQLLTNKSKKNHIYDQAQLDPAFQTSDPHLIEAARLGKQALKDYKTMVMLWDKFKNQAKIATFLGVNRSSVNRRCKEFNLE
ncbi:MAG TPA: sigma 54-interacting transcriptional regulator [Candidatus Limnocylindria bacterium]|nr:sigma 54-interacting transcriptional regulator [Candidatus Limnocylindria bacterium]